MLVLLIFLYPKSASRFHEVYESTMDDSTWVSIVPAGIFKSCYDAPIFFHMVSRSSIHQPHQGWCHWQPKLDSQYLNVEEQVLNPYQK